MSKTPWTKYADYELDLPVRWFTGAEWNDGTATRQFKQDYVEAIARKDAENKSRPKHVKGTPWKPTGTWEPWWVKKAKT